VREEDARQAMARRIECPVAWCDGAWLDHGGQGAPPDEWVHTGADAIDLPGGASLSRWSEGAGPVVWSLFIGAQAVADGTDLAAIAAQLRQIADAVEHVSEQ